jgi:hypothetical protein
MVSMEGVCGVENRTYPDPKSRVEIVRHCTAVRKYFGSEYFTGLVNYNTNRNPRIGGVF